MNGVKFILLVFSIAVLDLSCYNCDNYQMLICYETSNFEYEFNNKIQSYSLADGIIIGFNADSTTYMSSDSLFYFRFVTRGNSGTDLLSSEVYDNLKNESYEVIEGSFKIESTNLVTNENCTWYNRWEVNDFNKIKYQHPTQMEGMIQFDLLNLNMDTIEMNLEFKIESDEILEDFSEC